MTCPTCATAGRRGYCAPMRCYCGHRECHAFASWTPPARVNITDINTKRRDTSAWDERGEGGWIDKL